MKRLCPILIAMAAHAVLASPAFAQTCSGIQSFDERPFSAGVGFELASAVTLAEFGATVGNKVGFIGLHVGPYRYANGGRSTVWGIGGGFEIPAAPNRRVIICPNGSINTEKGPSVPGHPEYAVSSSVALAGLSVGAIAIDAGSFQVVPSINVSVVRAVQTVAVASIGSASAAANYGVADVGAGLVLADRVTLKAGWALPIHVTNGENRFSFGVAFSF